MWDLFWRKLLGDRFFVQLLFFPQPVAIPSLSWNHLSSGADTRDLFEAELCKRELNTAIAVEHAQMG
jgi:hypothetical protein